MIAGSGRLGSGGHDGGYEEVIKRAERLFARLRYSVAQQSAPTTLKSAFLDPIQSRLGLEVSLDLFAKSDEQFMAMFAGGSCCPCVADRFPFLRGIMLR